jgi:hypothetical protein
LRGPWPGDLFNLPPGVATWRHNAGLSDRIPLGFIESGTPRQVSTENVNAPAAYRFTFPNHDHAPAEFPERGLMHLVARGVAVEFGQPPFAPVRCGRSELRLESFGGLLS